MEVHDTVDAFRKALDGVRSGGRTVGLVPTMGALHQGHTSLLRAAAAGADVVAATIFVNPLQFGAGEDLAAYPRDLEADRRLAEAEEVAHLFAPSVAEMYPGEVRTRVTVAEVGDGPEGEFRPDHLAGVATVVAKLFIIAGPCRAYFGEKDWQQLQVVRTLVADLSFPVGVVACPTVREPDGLAVSSRNVRLSPAERQAATVLYRALLAGQAAPDCEDAMRRVVAREPLATLDYAVVSDGRLLLAARVGAVRLIDNLAVKES